MGNVHGMDPQAGPTSHGGPSCHCLRFEERCASGTREVVRSASTTGDPRRPTAAHRVVRGSGAGPARARATRLAAHLIVLLAAVAIGGASVFAQETVIDLVPIPISDTTGEKPQSKVWEHAGTWWAVLPSDSFSSAGDDGAWVWRLELDFSWTPVHRLSSNTSVKADVKSVGDVAHVLLYDGTSTQLVSVEYDAASDTYVRWSQRSTATSVSLSGSEIATIDVDSTGRMWLSTEQSSSVVVYYADPPYASFTGPIVLESGISSDDITVVTALPNDTIGVLWSNQSDERFGFRVHVDGANATTWLADEVPAAGGGAVADDHLNVAVAADGTLYAVVKTSFNDSASGKVQIGLLVRRLDGGGPGGIWENQSEPDELFYVDNDGTRGILLLNEDAGLLRVLYTSSGHDIIYRDSPISPIDFGPAETLMGGGGLNNATTTKMNWTDEVVVLASTSSAAEGVLIMRELSGSTTTTTIATTTSTTRAPTTTTTALPSTTTITSAPATTTTTTLPSGAQTLNVRVAASTDDAEEQLSNGAMDLGSSDLELIQESAAQTVGMRFTGITIPRRATIVNAYVQFQTDETGSTMTTLTLWGHDTDSAGTFTSTAGNISSRTKTAASVDWTPVAGWTTVGAQGEGQRTPNIAAVIQEIVDRDGWMSGNALAVIVTGSGKRVAEAYDGVQNAAPLLHVEYVPPSP